jgi:membrane protease YdiL (CAAX protease family)
MCEENTRVKPVDARAFLRRSTLGWAAAGLLGTAGMTALLIPGFPQMIAAQITAGIIGLAGGLSYLFLLRSAGGSVSRRHGFSLAAVWAASCILGVTPLFLTSGPPLKMMVLMFYSFAAAGALGGGVTAHLMGSIFADPDSPRDGAPSVVIWSFSVGVSAVASNIVGEGLQTVLPAWVAWLIAYEAMTLIIGTAGGYAVMRYLRSARSASDSPEGRPGPSFSGCGSRCAITILVLLCLPFYLNDLADIFLVDWRPWLAVDYLAVKLFPLTVMGWLAGTNRVERSTFGLEWPAGRPFWTVFFIGALSGVFIDQNGYQFLSWLHGYPPIGRMPAIADPLWLWIDLTLGLLLVSVVEETVFRGYLLAFLSRYTRSAAIIIGISAVAFGLIHWSGGLHKIVVTSAIGVIFMALYVRTRCLPALILAHFVINFIDSANIIPKWYFGFLFS